MGVVGGLSGTAFHHLYQPPDGAFARFTGGVLNLGEVSLPVVALFFALLFGWTFARSQMQAHFSTWGTGLPLVVAGTLAMLTWCPVFAIPDGRL